MDFFICAADLAKMQKVVSFYARLKRISMLLPWTFSVFWCKVKNEWTRRFPSAEQSGKPQ